MGKIHTPSHSSYFGIVDLAGFPKDRYFLYMAHWRPDFPMAHILPHWNWPGREGQITPVHVYTSGDEAELFLNGQSLGRKKKGQFEYRIRWDDVKYTPGELKVVAYKDGKEWATDVVQTTGPAAELKLAPDRETITADGKDLSYVTVTVADDQGRMVPRSKNHIKFDISISPGENRGGGQRRCHQLRAISGQGTQRLQWPGTCHCACQSARRHHAHGPCRWLERREYANHRAAVTRWSAKDERNAQQRRLFRMIRKQFEFCGAGKTAEYV